MKNFILFMCTFCYLVCYSHADGQQISIGDTSRSSKDTLIILSADMAIHFSEYKKDTRLWYVPRLVDLNKMDTILIKDYDYDYGSYPHIDISPDSNFFVLNNVASGYVYDGIDETLHYEYACYIIDIANAVTVWYTQSTCNGEWKNKNEWVERGEIMFKP